MGFQAQITRGGGILAAGVLAVFTTGRIPAEASPPRPSSGDQAEQACTLSMDPQLAVQTAIVGAQTTERLCVLVLGASPTLLEPAPPPGIGSLGGNRAAAAGSRKTAWMDYMLAPLVPAWSLRLTTKSAFEMNASDRLSSAAPPILVTGAGGSGAAYGKFGFSFEAPASPSSSLAPGAWTAFGDAGARSALLPSPLTSLRDAPAEAGDAMLLRTQLAAPPSAAGAAAGAAPVPLLPGK
jgi:hypothetical protein